MRKFRSRLNLLSLENRLTPAVTVAYSGGNLDINGDDVSNTVLISGGGSGINVYVVPGVDLAGSLGGNPAPYETPTYFRGTFNVTGHLDVNMGKMNDYVLCTFNDGSTTKLSDKIDIHLGDGSDDV